MTVLGGEHILKTELAVSFVWFRLIVLFGETQRDTLTPQTPTKELCHCCKAFVRALVFECLCGCVTHPPPCYMPQADWSVLFLEKEKKQISQAVL